jgi:cation transport ATPase
MIDTGHRLSVLLIAFTLDLHIHTPR